MHGSGWVTATIDIDRSSEFTGDDVDRYSDVVDLENHYEFVTVILPTLTSAAITPYIQREEDTDSVPVALHHFHDNDADGTVAAASTAGTGGIAVVFPLGGARWFRLYAGANQAADRTFYCRGFNRVDQGI